MYPVLVVSLVSHQSPEPGNEIRPDVRPDERRRQIEAGQIFQYGHHIFGFVAPADSFIQTESAVLIDHVQEFEYAAVSFE